MPPTERTITTLLATLYNVLNTATGSAGKLRRNSSLESHKDSIRIRSPHKSARKPLPLPPQLEEDGSRANESVVDEEDDQQAHGAGDPHSEADGDDVEDDEERLDLGRLTVSTSGPNSVLPSTTPDVTDNSLAFLQVGVQIPAAYRI